jgi:hypothetical protein
MINEAMGIDKVAGGDLQVYRTGIKWYIVLDTNRIGGLIQPFDFSFCPASSASVDWLPVALSGVSPGDFFCAV